MVNLWKLVLKRISGIRGEENSLSLCQKSVEPYFFAAEAFFSIKIVYLCNNFAIFELLRKKNELRSGIKRFRKLRKLRE